MKIIADLQLRCLQLETGEESYTLHFKCGVLRFNFQLTPAQVLALVRGLYVPATSDFEPIRGSKKHFIQDGYVVLDADTLAMPTVDKDGFRVEAQNR